MKIANNFISDCTIFTTLQSCHFQPSIIIRSGIIPDFFISATLRIITSFIDQKSSIFHSSKVFIVNFLYLEVFDFPFSIILRLATVCVHER